jgi:hypothetical protein
MPSGRILYLALADARGHWMRAHLLLRNLAHADLDVSVVTTTLDGAWERGPSLRLRAVPLGLTDLQGAVAEAAGALDAGRPEREEHRARAGGATRGDRSCLTTGLVELVTAARVQAANNRGRRLLAGPLLRPGTP